MAKIITENFRVQTTNELFRSFTEGNASVVSEFSSELTEWLNTGGISLSNEEATILKTFTGNKMLEVMNASQPDSTYYVMGSSITKGETITNSQFQKREFQRRVIFGSKVTQDDIRYMFDINNWQTGTVYDSFDDNADISTLNMYVTVLDGVINEGSYKVFKCLRNNNGGPSTVQPNTADVATNFEVMTDDGYVWKYMFTVPPSEYLPYSTVISLPYLKDQTVIDNTVESISDIIIENTLGGLFAEYNLPTLLVRNVTLESQDVDSYTWKLELRTTDGAIPKNTVGAYTNMYLRFTNEGTVYDIQQSDAPATGGAADVYLNVYITNDEADFDIEYEADTPCFISPKVQISGTTGTRAIAYGMLDDNGTLTDVEFVEKGTNYKYATAKVLMPPALADKSQETSLRAIVSPRGGHGSDPISELYMSKLAVIANVFSDTLNDIPDSNTYTRVGLVKNPSFKDDAQPTTFDNRMKVYISGDLTSLATDYTNYYITQTVNGEEIHAKIHEMTYDSINEETTLHLVDYIGDWAGTFVAGNVKFKESLDSFVSNDYDINTVSESDLGFYTDYSGDLLHFVDFNAIERIPGRREKIKFVFDF